MTAFHRSAARLGCSSCFMAIAALMAAPAAANEGDEAPAGSDIVVTAAGFEQKITDAPASITVVTAEELRERPYMTLIDAVRDIEGVDVGETSDKTGQRTISIRGMGSDYTLILIDGRRQNNHGDIYPNSFGGNQFNHIPPLDAIERIEVIRGPASTLYGADALGGVINIIMKKVLDRWSGSATFGRSIQEDSDFGDDMTFDANVSGPIVPGIIGMKLRGSFYKRYPSEPDFAPVVDPAGVSHVRGLGFGGGGKTVKNTNRSYGGSLTFTPSPDHSLIFDIDYSKQVYDNTPIVDPVSGAITYPLGTLDGIESIWRASGGIVQPRVGYTENQVFDRLSWAGTYNGDFGFARAFLSFAYIETNNKGRTMPFSVAERQLLQQMFSGTGPYAGMPTAQRRALAESTFLPRPLRTLESAQYTLDARIDIPVENLAGRHHFVIGGQYIDGTLDDGVFGLEAAVGGIEAVQDHRIWSLFAEDNWTIFEGFTLTGGIRYDNHNLFGGHFSPRIYANYAITPTLTVKGGVSTGYKTPKTTDLYDGIRGFGGQGTSPFIGNPDLKPETSVNSEAAIYWNPTANSGINVTLFHNKFKDKIDTTIVRPCALTNFVRPCANLGDYYAVLGLGSTISIPFNVDKARIKGAEVAGRYQFFPGLSLRANYTYTDSKQLTGASAGQPLTQSAKHMANATIDWEPLDGLSTQLSAEHRSRRYRGVATNGDHLYYKSYTVLNLGAQYRLNDHLTISGRVNNLLDRDFRDYDVDFGNPVNGAYTPTYIDHYNNKDKARSYWVSVNARF
ncbi:TonB-dependent receptor domain-containing protein [Sphingopyxis sp.]|jgi:outer membrane receptor for ferrienterochelin and colicins|uniref:TonB-dependent receptor domain-containing protein n=1 Tax=Sphingopyxis sp. TaxID=1908224 RepID=UPI002E0CEB5B|nr:TonB-dependent receptor [Sphingopyxis sp.]